MKNLAVRTLSGIGFIAIMVGGLLWSRYSFAVLMLWIMVMMMYEFFRMTMGSSYKFSRLLTMIAGCILFALTFLYQSHNFPGNLVILSIIPVFIVMIDSLYVKDKTEFGKFANLYTAMLYIAVPMALTNLVVFDGESNYNGMTLLCFFIIIWASDVGAYIFGITLGQKYGRKLFPSISPKKSWIGFWGGFAFALAVAAALQQLGILEMSLIQSLALGAVIDISGVYGDLIESQWKRHYSVKDSGHGIPGHGGYLDRFDSALTGIPMGIIFTRIIQMF